MRKGSREATFRSGVTNGRDVLPGVDGRSQMARRYYDIMSAILIDQGGEDRCSESRKQLIRRFTAAAVLAEQMEAKMCSGEEVSIQDHALLTSSLVRVAQRIGVNRIPRNLAPTLEDYLRQKQSEAAE